MLSEGSARLVRAEARAVAPWGPICTLSMKRVVSEGILPSASSATPSSPSLPLIDPKLSKTGQRAAAGEGAQRPPLGEGDGLAPVST